MSASLSTPERLRLGGKYADTLIRLGGTFPSEPMFERIEGALAFVGRMSTRLDAESPTRTATTPARVLTATRSVPIMAESTPGNAAGWLPREPYKGWPEHRYIYSSEGGDSCSCGWSPTHFRMADQAEWDQHVEAQPGGTSDA